MSHQKQPSRTLIQLIVSGFLHQGRTVRKGLALSLVLALIVAGLAMQGLASTGSVTADGSATVSTDKADYEPQETVNFSGTGFQPGETVNLTGVGSSNGSKIAASATADAVGAISGKIVLPLMYEETYTLTATGASSGQTAKVTFGDAVTALQVQTPSSPVTIPPGGTQVYTVLAKTGTGAGVPGVTLTWGVQGGASVGSMSPPTSVTNASGLAAAPLPSLPEQRPALTG